MTKDKHSGFRLIDREIIYFRINCQTVEAFLELHRIIREEYQVICVKQIPHLCLSSGISAPYKHYAQVGVASSGHQTEVVGRSHLGLYPTVKEFVKEQHRTEQEIERIEHGKKNGEIGYRSSNSQREEAIQTLFVQRETLRIGHFLTVRMARSDGFAVV